MPLIEIHDAADPRLADYVSIRERDLVRAGRKFIAEGKSVLAVLAMQKRFKPESILVLENRLGGIEALLSQFDATTPIYRVNKTVMDAVAGFPMHRGILAVVNRPAQIDASPEPAAIENWRRVVVLIGLANHDNVGAIFRNAAAFGFDAVLLDSQSCDPLYRKAVRVSVGGVLKTPFHILEDAASMIALLSGAHFQCIGLSPDAPTPLNQWQPGKKTALFLGAEGPGLPATIMDQLTNIAIEMAPGFDSLNVATAAAIAMHHVSIKA